MLVCHPMEDHKKVFFTQILTKVKAEVLKPHFEVNTKARMVDIIKIKANRMEVDEEILKEEEVMVEVIEVNNQIMIQTITTMGNLGTWQRTLIKGNYASTSNQGDEQLFVMQHMENSMIGGVSNNNV